MKRLLCLLVVVSGWIPGFAAALPGTATLIIYQHTGGPPVNLENASLPDQFFTAPDAGSGSFVQAVGKARAPGSTPTR